MSESLKYTTLQPVVLANDDYEDDSEITHLKEVAASEFAANSHVNVSTAMSINVTADNVEQLYDGVVSSVSQDSYIQGAQAAYQLSDPLDAENLLSLVRDLPKELFVSQVLKDAAPSRDRLEIARSEVFSCIKNSEGYPFDSRASLKKRINTHTGDSIENKLAYDLYCLSSVLDGADWGELHEVINVPKPTKKSQSSHEASFCAYPSIDLDQLKRSVQTMSADILAMKQENTDLRAGFLSEIKSLRSDLSQIKDDLEADLREVWSLVSTNALSIDRICDDKSNGVANIKSEIKLVKSELKKGSEEPILSLNSKSISDSVLKMGTFERRLSRVEQRLKTDHKSCDISANSNQVQDRTPSTGEYTDDQEKTYSSSK